MSTRQEPSVSQILGLSLFFQPAIFPTSGALITNLTTSCYSVPVLKSLSKPSELTQGTTAETSKFLGLQGGGALGSKIKEQKAWGTGVHLLFPEAAHLPGSSQGWQGLEFRTLTRS